MMGRRLLALAAGVLVMSLAAAGCGSSGQPEVARRAADILLRPELEIIEDRVPRNATLASLLEAHLGDELVGAVVASAREVFDPRRLRADHPYRIVRTLDGLLRRFEYHIDGDRFLRIVHALDPEPVLRAEVVPYVKHKALVAMRGTIDRETPTLVGAIDRGGERVELAITLADVFGGEIDFHNDLRLGDRFDVLFEREIREGQFAGYGAIQAAEFENDGRRLRAFRFQVPGQPPGYYDAQGRSLRRFFLRSPLRFEPRVTSRFSRRRLHPILGRYRAHLGVDYGAPRGAPVVAVASGTVVSAGWSGGAGRMVRLRHARGYQTYYLHLSAIAPGIRPGARVAQGQLVGRVGATGLATGPHLDYRVSRNGVFVDPLREHRNMPPGEPIPIQYAGAFAATRELAMVRLGWPEPALTASAATAAGSPVN